MNGHSQPAVGPEPGTHPLKQRKRLSATVYYLLAGIAAGWPVLFATGRLVPIWQAGAADSGGSLAAIHVLVLGSMLTIAFGVLYQIVPIAFRAPPVARHVLYWHLPLHLAAVCVMAAGFWLGDFLLVGMSGSVLVAAATAYLFLLFRSYRRAGNKTTVYRGLLVPFSSLCLVFAAGLVQAFGSGRTPFHLVVSHVLLGGLAFWGGLVLVFAYKLVPMFVLSHGYRASLPRSGLLYFSGTALFIAAQWIPNLAATRAADAVAAVLVIAGLAAFARDLTAIVSKRKRRRIVLPLWDAFAALVCIIAGAGGIAVAAPFGRSRWLFAFIYLFTFGGLLPLMFSFMQKMVPFLWFEYRFSKRPERKSAPLIDDMVSKPAAQAAMGLYFAGALTQFATLWSGGSGPTGVWLDWGGALCMTAGSLLLFASLWLVLQIGGTRPPD